MDVAFTVRSAVSSDSCDILACLQEAFASFRKEYSPAGYADTVLTAATLAERMRSMRLFVAVTPAGGLVGTIGCAISGDEAHIRGMAVLPAWQGRAIAVKLLERVEQECRAHGCRRISLDTTAPLARAMRFYERHGYERSGRVGDFFGMPLFEYVKVLKSRGARLQFS